MKSVYNDIAGEYDSARRMRWDLQRWLWSNTENGNRWFGGQQSEAFGKKAQREYRNLVRLWESLWRSLESGYFDRLGAIMPGQDGTIASLRRARLRHRLFAKPEQAFPEGSATDLVDICTRFDPVLVDQPGVKAELLQYEMALHELLRSLDEGMVTQEDRAEEQRAAVAAARAEGRDVAEFTDATQRIELERTIRSRQIWQLHAVSARRIAGAVADEQVRSVLEDRFHAKLRRYVKSDHGMLPEAAFEEALKRRDLSDDQRERLNALQRSYRALRNSATPSLDEAFLSTSDPSRNIVVRQLLDQDNRDEARRRMREWNDSWNETLTKWLEQCAMTVRAINEIVPASDRSAATSQPMEVPK